MKKRNNAHATAFQSLAESWRMLEGGTPHSREHHAGHLLFIERDAWLRAGEIEINRIAGHLDIGTGRLAPSQDREFLAVGLDWLRQDLLEFELRLIGRGSLCGFQSLPVHHRPWHSQFLHPCVISSQVLIVLTRPKLETA